MGVSVEMDALKKGWFSEVNGLWPGQAMSLEVEEVLHSEKSQFQDILIFQRSSIALLFAEYHFTVGFFCYSVASLYISEAGVIECVGRSGDCVIPAFFRPLYLNGEPCFSPPV